MTRLLTLALLILTLTTGCMMADPYGPRTSNSLTHGMTQSQVESSWGPPWSRSDYRIGGHTYETWSYRRRTKTFMPSGARTYYDWYSVSFEDGRVVGIGR